MDLVPDAGLRTGAKLVKDAPGEAFCRRALVASTNQITPERRSETARSLERRFAQAAGGRTGCRRNYPESGPVMNFVRDSLCGETL